MSSLASVVSKTVAAGAVGIVLAATATHAADPLIIVDVTDPANVVFRTYGTALSGVSWSDSSSNGIVIGSFFSDNTASLAGPFTGEILVLASNDSTTRRGLPWAYIGSFIGGWTTNDVGFYDPSDPGPIFINAGQRSFTGEITVDLTGTSGLPGTNASGPIYFGPPDLGQSLGGWVVRPIVRGDFDLDNNVNGRDFLAWQHGNSITPLSAADLAEWDEHFGSPAEIAEAANPVPEPPAGLLLLVAAMFGAGGCRYWLCPVS